MTLAHLRAPAALLLLALLPGCGGLFETKVKDILDNPKDYEGQVVRIRGTVKEAVNVVILKYYVVDDGSGEMPVVTKRAVPAKGAKVSARGKVKQAFSLGDATLTVLVEDE